MDSEWIGGVRLFTSKDLPVAKPVANHSEPFPLVEYQTSLKACERAMWPSGTHGTVTQVAWISRPGILVVSALDGTLMQLTQNVLEENIPVHNSSEAKQSPPMKASQKEPTTKKSFSKVIYTHPDRVDHMKALDNPNGVPYLVSANSNGTIVVLDLAAAKVSNIASKAVSFRPCTALCTSGTTIAAAFQDRTVHLLDSQLNETTRLTAAATEDPVITSVAISASNPNLVAISTLDQTLQLYDLRNTANSVHHVATESVNRGLKFGGPQNSLIAAGSDDGFVRVYDTSTETSLKQPVYSFKHGDRVTTVSWNPEKDNEVVSASFDGLMLRHPIESQ